MPSFTIGFHGKAPLEAGQRCNASPPYGDAVYVSQRRSRTPTFVSFFAATIVVLDGVPVLYTVALQTHPVENEGMSETHSDCDRTPLSPMRELGSPDLCPVQPTQPVNAVQ